MFHIVLIWVLLLIFGLAILMSPACETPKTTPTKPLLSSKIRTRYTTISGAGIHRDLSASIHWSPSSRVNYNVSNNMTNSLQHLWENRKTKFAYQTEPWTVWQNLVNKEIAFSVIVPVHNQEKIIHRTLTAIAQNMSGTSYEMIILCDGCTDSTETVVRNWVMSHSLPVAIVHIAQSVFETACDNIGFQLASSDLLLEVQADMTMTESNFHLQLEKPLQLYNDIIAVSGRCTHDADDAIGRPTDMNVIVSAERDKCFLMATVNRGPLLLDRQKLMQCGWLDETHFAQGNDDHDLFYRAWKDYGWRVAYMPIFFDCDISDGSTRKPMPDKERAILKLRTSQTPHKIIYSKFRLATFRVLSETQMAQRRHHVTFANRETIHYTNAEMAAWAHEMYGVHFDTERLYHEQDVKEFLTSLPHDTQHERGYHYWAWKPWIIKHTMEHINENDVIVYTDSGLYFKDAISVQRLISHTEEHGYKLFRTGHKNLPYMKCEVVQYVRGDGLLNGLLDEYMVDASVILLKNTEANRRMIDDWLDMVKTPFMLSDVLSGACENGKEFVDHRHDQALLTIAAKRHGLSFEHMKGDKICHHHRSQNQIELDKVIAKIQVSVI